MTEHAPAASALVISPENLMPPSAITPTPYLAAASAHCCTAVNCGTPMPAITRVVQMEPGPMPTLTQSAPALMRSTVPSAVATLPAIICRLGYARPDLFHRLNHGFWYGRAPSQW